MRTRTVGITGVALLVVAIAVATAATIAGRGSSG